MSHNSSSSLELQKRRCKFIVPKENDLCWCLNSITEHDRTIVEEFMARKDRNDPDLGSKWDKELCTEDFGPTDAFGKIIFSETDKLANYVRLSYRTEVNKLIDLLFKSEYWNIKEPELIISVTGAAEKISLDQKLKDAFSNGLVKAAVTTNALVTTGGTNGGCMKLVGEAFRLNAFSIDQSNKVNLLGIADWCPVYNKSALINTDSKSSFVEYNSVKSNRKVGKKSVLEPNHSHFILVDDAYNYFGADIELRARLEGELGKKAKIVVLAIGGGPNSAKSICEAINEGTPCVILESSGGMECGFAYAINRIKSVPTKDDQIELLKSEDFWNEVRRQLIRGYSNTKDPDSRADKTLKWIKESLKIENLHLFTVCRSRNGRAELDVAILEALLYAGKDKEKDFETQLKLALSWNRIDIARNYLFIGQNIDRVCSSDHFISAVIDNKHQFVELFLDNGFCLKSFLTKRQLLLLYNKAIKKNKSSYLYKTIDKMIDKKRVKSIENTLITFEMIGKVITKLVDHVYKHKFKCYPYKRITEERLKQYLEEVNAKLILDDEKEFNLDEEFDNPDHEMFIFNVLLSQFEMSLIFLRRGNNPICSALIAGKITKNYDIEFCDDFDDFEDQAQDYITLACDILKKYYEKDEFKSQLTLIRRVNDFGGITCLKVATLSRNLDFISMQSFQNLIKRIWYYKILPDANKFLLSLCLANPFIAKCVIEYRVKPIESQEKKSDDVKTKTGAHEEKNYDTESLIKKKDEDEIKRIDKELTNEFFDRGIEGDYYYFEFLYHFLNTPFTKFIYHQIWYLFFLILFSYVIVCDFHKINQSNEKTSLGLAISIPEIILIIWVFTFILEEIYKFLINDMKKYFIKKIFGGDFWQKINTSAILLYLVAFILRFIDNDQCYKAARIILALDILLWFLKFLKAYTLLRQLGPKFYVIVEMLTQLAYFMLIVLVFMFAFGISSTALMFENSELNINLVKNVFLPGYFMIGGEYYTLEEIMSAASGTCTDTEVYEKCPDEIGASVALALYIIYLIFLNILLVNLLIAIFDNAYDTVEQKANEIWKFQLYELVNEYYNKPFLPAPFIIFNIFVSLVKFTFKMVAKLLSKNKTELAGFKFLLKNRLFRSWAKKWNHSLVYELDELEEKEISGLEEKLAEELISMREKKKRENFEDRVEQNFEKLDLLTSKFEDFVDKGNILLNQSVQSIDAKLEKMLK
ncbi:transient receptor potential cation channel subfamily M member 3 isoform X26 [Brachionus plicatilis]|uniref:Transient receptor potential cation channel subfamily M member 3 isoform X26 n=1 Tax=Brachionus plicatilis TaxID=10195 RepID=A0A3M7QEJ6_BRAPC|nr:transient receptor potential cation channel subfamily M member 3 isoform X26 [Brachionus plicatilis]